MNFDQADIDENGNACPCHEIPEPRDLSEEVLQIGNRPGRIQPPPRIFLSQPQGSPTIVSAMPQIWKANYYQYRMHKEGGGVLREVELEKSDSFGKSDASACTGVVGAPCLTYLDSWTQGCHTPAKSVNFSISEMANVSGRAVISCF